MDGTLVREREPRTETEASSDEIRARPSAEEIIPKPELQRTRARFRNQVLILVSAPLARAASRSDYQSSSEPSFADIPPLVVWQEILSVADALRGIQPPSQFELKLAIANANEFRDELFRWERPLIIHFIGHGMNKSGFRGLIIEDDVGTAKELDEFKLRSILNPLGRPPCYLAVLNACHSAILSSTLIELGVQFVISVNAEDEILDETARAFTTSFYRALLKESLSIRQAFEKACGSVTDNYTIEQSVDSLTYRPANEVEGAKYKLKSLYGRNRQLPFEATSGRVVFPAWEKHTNLDIKPDHVFLGRQRDIHHINKGILRIQKSLANECLAIHGMPGMGKTELAKAVGRWQCERRRWIDGVWHVDLRNVRSAILAGDKIRNFVPHLPAPAIEGNDAPSISPAASRTLIILDDLDELLEHDGPGCHDLINSLLLYPGVQVITTSREDIPLSLVQNYPYTLSRLDDSATTEIFKGYAHLTEPNESLAELTSFLQGYPLPTRLAAAYMAARRLSIHELCERIKKSSENTLRDPSAKPSRDTVLSITLDLSYQILPDRDKDLLHILAIFPSGMTKPLAEHLKGAPGVEALEELLSYSMAELMDKEPSRFALPEPARQYVLGKSNHNYMNQYARPVLQYLEGYLVSLLGAYNLDESAEIDLLEDAAVRRIGERRMLDEASNLRKFLEWGYENEETNEAICYSARLTALLAVNYARLPESERSDLVRRLDRASTAAERLGDAFGLVRVLQGKGEISLMAENLDGALNSYLKAEQVYTSYSSAKEFESPDGQRNLGAIYHRMGDVYRRKTQQDSAVQYYVRSIKVFHKLGSYTDAARAYRDIGHIKREGADHSSALKAYTEAVRLFLKGNDYRNAAYLDQEIGNIQTKLGELQLAMQSYMEAANLYHRARDHKLEGRVYELIGDISWEARLYEGAEEAYQKAILSYRFVDVALVAVVEKKLSKLNG